MTSHYFWLDERIVRAMHADQIARYGGSPGLRDQSLLSASLARPQHLATYGQSSTLFDLAAAYGFGLTNNHPFIDGNKRTAFVVMATFLELNGYTLVAPEPEVVGMMEDLASGLVSQEQMSRWLESYCDVSY